ncbi:MULTISPECIES: hypothetical protein [unclassified Lysobacter]|uniref:hypothetical protein n=1 Tax=unclassified Lysobacter TaxID=2635362 RepID=UPI001BEB13E9|nr:MULTISPECIES: hypothetical protein [unclassified Lysobacter]MBT2746250.1 hypothetical protein [Lysobacter sp. ISL-42]MBT2751277.1 hypothetical protein [Lysobacter sp. ISL-50]MBT2775685.1 hypothetical protein [Lysobacter sp. ISL-54]MBT2780070.1 hypothetical protein [Lysobacter sp. ISL-52]
MNHDADAAMGAGASPSQARSAAMLAAPVVATLQRLRAVLPAQADAARVMLAGVLAPLHDSCWPEVAWSFSRLTNTGLPVEFAWTSREAAVRWTAEVAAPEVDENERLAIAAQALGWQGDLAPWFEHQRGHRLKFGAWVSARHGDGLATKLYVDLPDGRLPPAWRKRHALFDSALMFWRMCGVNPDGSVECYARASELDLAALRMLAQASLGDAGPMMRRVAQVVPANDLPRPSGISLALSADGQVRALTWFTFAKAIFRDDAQVAACMRGLGEGLSAQVYEALAAGPADGRWRHGMVGVGADIAGNTWVQCGLRPT